MAYLTIDQAGKIEKTSDDTILALFSEDIQYSIRILKKLKQHLFNSCNKRHKKLLTLKMFSYCLYLLLKNKVDKNSIVIIDDEYSQHGRDIKDDLLRYLKLDRDQIQFRLVGKDDPSHDIANKTFGDKLKPNQVIREIDLNLQKIFSERKLKKILK